MAVGFRIRGLGGQVLVDNTFASIAFVQKGTATLAVHGGDLNMSSTATVTITGEFPVIAFRSSVPVALWYVEQSGSTWIYHFLSSSSNAGASFQWFAFDRPPEQRGGVGLVVRNTETGAITFDSRYRYMRVGGFESIDARTPQSFTSYPSRTWAVAMLQMGCVTPVAFTPPAPPPGGLWHWNATLWMSGLTIASTGFTSSTITAATTNGVSQNLPSYPQSPIGQVLLIDVTNF